MHETPKTQKELKAIPLKRRENIRMPQLLRFLVLSEGGCSISFLKERVFCLFPLM